MSLAADNGKEREDLLTANDYEKHVNTVVQFFQRGVLWKDHEQYTVYCRSLNSLF